MRRMPVVMVALVSICIVWPTVSQCESVGKSPQDELKGQIASFYSTLSQKKYWRWYAYFDEHTQRSYREGWIGLISPRLWFCICSKWTDQLFGVGWQLKDFEIQSIQLEDDKAKVLMRLKIMTSPTKEIVDGGTQADYWIIENGKWKNYVAFLAEDSTWIDAKNIHDHM